MVYCCLYFASDQFIARHALHRIVLTLLSVTPLSTQQCQANTQRHTILTVIFHIKLAVATEILILHLLRNLCTYPIGKPTLKTHPLISVSSHKKVY